MQDLYSRFEKVFLAWSGLDAMEPSMRLSEVAPDSLDIIQLALDLEDEFQFSIPDESMWELYRTDVSVADVVNHLVKYGNGEQWTELVRTMSERYLPELSGTPHRIDSRTWMLRLFMSDSIFKSFLGSKVDAEKHILLAFFNRFGSYTVRNLFGVPVKEDGNRCFYIILYLEDRCGLIKVSCEADEVSAEAFSDIQFAQVTMGPSTLDQWAWALSFGGKTVYISVDEQFSGLVLARLKEVKRFLSEWSLSPEQTQFLGKRHLDRESMSVGSQTASVMPQCLLSASVVPPHNIVSPSHLREYLSKVPSENELIHSIVEPILRGRMFNIVRSIHHGVDDTSQERGADVVAARPIMHDLYLVACVVKRGSLRKRGNTQTAKFADVVDQIRLALSCPISVDGVTKRPDVVYLVVSGEVPEDLKRDLVSLNTDMTQNVLVWDRPSLIDLYLQSNISVEEQYQMYKELAAAM
jgi:acyl carrier protein